jgi:hypothetical protein
VAWAQAVDVGFPFVQSLNLVQKQVCLFCGGLLRRRRANQGNDVFVKTFPVAQREVLRRLNIHANDAFFGDAFFQHFILNQPEHGGVPSPVDTYEHLDQIRADEGADLLQVSFAFNHAESFS